MFREALTNQELPHTVYIVDATIKPRRRAGVITADQQGLATSRRHDRPRRLGRRPGLRLVCRPRLNHHRLLRMVPRDWLRISNGGLQRTRRRWSCEPAVVLRRSDVWRRPMRRLRIVVLVIQSAIRRNLRFPAGRKRVVRNTLLCGRRWRIACCVRQCRMMSNRAHPGRRLVDVVHLKSTVSRCASK